MIEDSYKTAQALNALCQQANQRAAGWQSATAAGGPATPAAHRERLPRSLLLKAGLISGLSALALAVLATQLDADPVPISEFVQDDAVPHRLPPLPPLQPSATSAPAEPLRWQADEAATKGTAATLSNPGVDSQPNAEPTHTVPGEIESQPGGSC